ncbi:hypothetical protein FOQG_12735 [Fusarium oxysporum f. sp. raphani 54005]|uniref:Uncharacterized protein n=1 Tax=Fusarium oxysporum f. sp. raphani 54005 TaxID=1089458 RepID=X0CK17_FUSOX|nr:hypothetical protein FOQG_12735 [Fusarium oxysporum f. sp. raphani 54005]
MTISHGSAEHQLMMSKDWRKHGRQPLTGALLKPL